MIFLIALHQFYYIAKLYENIHLDVKQACGSASEVNVNKIGSLKALIERVHTAIFI